MGYFYVMAGLAVFVVLAALLAVGCWIYDKGRRRGANYFLELYNMKKRDEIEQPNSCLNKAHEDEPVFVLRAKDPVAAVVVEEWAHLSQRTGRHEPAKIAEARALAQQMRDWYTENISANRAQLQADAANKHEG